MTALSGDRRDEKVHADGTDKLMRFVLSVISFSPKE